MAYASADDRRRWSGALASGAVQLLLAAIVIRGLAAQQTQHAGADRAPVLVTVFEPEPPPPRVPPPPPSDAGQASGKGAPPARKAQALPRAAPSPRVMLAPPRPAATEPGSGIAVRPGLGPAAGPGDGAGGAGNGPGTGSGGSGSGAGAGAGGNAPPARIAGTLGDRDYPPGAARRRAAGTAAVSFRVRTDGRVDRCTILASSGDAELDALTCTLVQRRFVYRPARSAAGMPVEATVKSTFTWGVR